MYNTLIIPVESQAREFDAKLLLSLIAAEQGFTVYLGSRAYTHYLAPKLKNSIYIAKSMRRFSDRMFKIMHDLGHRVVAWDEEALVRLPDKQYFLHRLSENNAQYIDHLFAWGPDNAKTFASYAPYRNIPVHITGNPRIDMLRKDMRSYYHREIDNLLDRYGNYFLINTNFGQINHFTGVVGQKETSRDVNYDKAHQSNFMQERFQHKTKLFELFQQMIAEVASDFKDVNFIVRPHPSENAEFWKEKYQAYSNIIVENEGNVLPWMFASSGVIANNCTTLVEAAVAKIPAIGYYPIENEKIDDFLPKSISLHTSTLVALKETIEEYRNGISEYSPFDSKNVLDDHIRQPNDQFISEKIVNILKNNYANLNTSEKPYHRAWGKTHSYGRTFVKRINRFRKYHRGNLNYHQHRYPVISEKIMLEKYQNIKNCLNGRFRYINIDPINQYIYKINPNKAEK